MSVARAERAAGARIDYICARALATRPRLLILDEATSGLDADSEAEVLKGLGRLKGRLTMISVTHRQSVRAGASAVLACEDGRVHPA